MADMTLSRALDDHREQVASWAQHGRCLQADPDTFYPEKGGSTREAKRICAECPVIFECLEYALENDERFGVWGGLSERERRKVRRSATNPDEVRAMLPRLNPHIADEDEQAA